MTLTIAQFLERLEASGILADADLAAVREEAGAEDAGGDAEPLVKRLHKQGRITAYQAQALWKDKGQKLSFGNYVIEDELGRGGMGVVLKARHKRMQRYVAIKVLPAAMVKDTAAIARFQREVVAAAQLNHPNIVGAHDADEINGQHILVMEFVDGRDLSGIVKKSGPLDLQQAIDCVIQAARGLEFAHRQGVIHRDIKPANLLLDAAGIVKILDMGLARFSGTADVGTQAELTGTGTVMGTVDYMSPEQALNTKTADARSDIYSLGITLYYLLTARPVYEGDSLMARLMAHANSPIPPLTAARPDADDNLQAVFAKMIAKQPDERHETMTEVIADLEACRGESSGTAVIARPAAAAARSSGDGLSAFLNNPGDGGVSATAQTRTAAKAGTSGTHTKVTGAEQTLITSPTSGTVPTLPPRVGRGRKASPVKSGGSSALWTDWRVLSGAGGALVVLLAILILSRKPADDPTTVVNAGATPTAINGNMGGDGTAASLPAPPVAAVMPGPNLAPPPAVAPFDPAAARGALTPADGWVDLLPIVDLAIDAPPQGIFSDPGVRTQSELLLGHRTLLTLPVSMHGSYQLRAQFTTSDGPKFLFVDCPIADRLPVLVLADNDNQLGYLGAGLQPIDGRLIRGADNPTLIKERVLIPNQQQSLDLTVTAEGPRISVNALLDGKPFVDWTGAATSLPAIAADATRRITVASYKGMLTFHSLELKLLDGEMKLLRPIAEITPPEDTKSGQ